MVSSGYVLVIYFYSIKAIELIRSQPYRRREIGNGLPGQPLEVSSFETLSSLQEAMGLKA
jgi:transcription antitermination factor NusG